MATKKVPLIRVDEDYIDMIMSPYDKLSPKQQTRGFARSQSCRFRADSNPTEYQFQCSTKAKEHWSKKVKYAKKSLLVQKLKSYKAYLKSLFTKTACSADKSNVVEMNKPKCPHNEEGKRKSFQNIYDEKRRSSASSYFSINLAENYNRLSVNSETEEGSIAEAIAHCKQSQQGNGSNKDSHE
ncbi:hypothetical protein MtrunA17_Chr7g0263411 [Medicago truncatula]|uniref:Uncharacterized protein n=1 Tax=Medicago truncatula TaxID=3880 RepID=G7L0Q3_MEDTR|nr:probable membrane-associated kinase regulator 4 [Medicago truncatula]AES81768.1 hypothetical protein MTR_7g100380 [Medicago truncatula]RHN48404.1 hypothetical protein MtrunA17_Chr7g0263411 [Medicago truncatula]